MARRGSVGRVRTKNKGGRFGGHRLSSNARVPRQRVAQRMGHRG